MGAIRPRLVKLLTAALLAVAAPAFGGGPGLAMLDQLDNGEWELRERAGAPAQRICLQSGRQLVQLRHPRLICQIFIAEDGASQVVVQYTCKGRGYGRTRVRRETGQLVQLDTQGIADGLPFDFSVEARRVGECTKS